MAAHNCHPADKPPAMPQPRQPILVRLGVVAMLAVIGCCGWLLYPALYVRLCAWRVASFYEPQPDSNGEVTQYVLRPRSDNDGMNSWSMELNSQPIARLLTLLDSHDPLWVWVGAQAIGEQLGSGRLVGWPGTRTPVGPLGADELEVVLITLRRELPEPVRDSLLKLVATARTNSPSMQEVFRRAAYHRDVRLRVMAVRLVEDLDPRLDSTLELFDRLANDPEPVVRAGLLMTILQPAAKVRRDGFPPRYLESALRATTDPDEAVRVAAARVIEIPELDGDALFELVARLWKDPDARVPSAVATVLVDSSPRRSDSPRLARYTPDELPQRYVELLFDGLEDADPAVRRAVLRWGLVIPTIAAERQWALVEQELKTASKSPWEMSGLRRALFAPDEPKENLIRSSGGIDMVDALKLRERLGPLAELARPRLIEWATTATTAKDETTAWSALTLLVDLATEDSDCFLPALSNPSATVRSWALSILNSRNVRRRVEDGVERADALPGKGFSREQVARIFELLHDPEEQVRISALAALHGRREPFSREQLDELRALVRNDSERTGQQAFDLVAAQEPDDTQLLQVVLERLDSANIDTRDWATRTLLQFPARMAEAIPPLFEGMRRGQLGPDAVRVLIHVGKPIESPEDVRAIVATLFGSRRRQNRPAPGAMPATPYSAMQSDFHPDLTFRRLADLVKLCPKQALIEALLVQLGHEQELARKGVAKFLAEMPTDAAELLPRLLTMLDSPQWETRQGALFCLVALGTPPALATPSLVKRLGDTQAPIRTAAAEALAAIGPDAGPEVAAALAKMAQHDPLPGCQAAALAALCRMGQHARPFAGTIEKLTRDPELLVRNAATRALGQVKSESE